MRGSFGARRRGRAIHRLATGWMVVAILTSLLAQASPTWAVGANDPAPIDPNPAAGPVPAAGPYVVGAGAVPIDLANSGGGGAGAGSTGVAIRTARQSAAAPAVETEIVSARTENTRTIALPNGNRRVEVIAGRMHYQDAKGAWQPIDLSLRVANDSTYGLSVAALDRDVSFSTGRGDTAIAKISVNGVGALSLRAPGRTTPQRNLSRLTYAADTNAPALLTQPTDTGFEFQGIWNDASVGNTLDVTLNTQGLVPVVAKDGRTIDLLRFVDNGDFVSTVVAGSISAPLLLEGGEGGQPALDPSLVSVALYPLPGPTWTLRYTVASSWLADPARQFPVVLDPQVCIGAGASGCDHNITSGVNDTFILNAQPNNYPTGWNRIRVGYDASGVGFGVQRSLVYFPSFDSSIIPEGSLISAAQLRVHVAEVYGAAVGKQIDVFGATQGWGSTTTWNGFGSGAAYTGVDYSWATVPSSGYIDFYPSPRVSHMYTQRASDWVQNLGFLIKLDDDSAGSGSINLNRWNDGTAAYRPLLSIVYQTPAAKLSFDPALGTNYAPSTMVAGQATTIPMRITNNSGFTFKTPSDDANEYDDLGYRWIDDKGAIVGSGSTHLPATLLSGQTSATIPLAVTPPSGAGRYSLRVEAMLYEWGNLIWASDYTLPSLFYARAKYSGELDNSRWTGLSSIERDEFPINVVSTTPQGGEWRTVTLGDGATVGINLWSRDLTYTGDEGVGFEDLLTVGLRYDYRSSANNDKTGTLGAYGWSTNFDERINASSDPGKYIYQDPSGNRSPLATTPDGQLAGAGVDITRPRVTIWDETGSSAEATLVNPGFGAFSGTYALSIASDANHAIAPSGFQPFDLGVWPVTAFAVRTSAATATGIGFKIKNLTTGVEQWYHLDVGAGFADGIPATALGYQASHSTLVGDWNYYRVNLRAQLLANGTFGSVNDEFRVTDVRTVTAPGATGTTYLDGFRMETTPNVAFADDPPSGMTSGAGLTTDTDTPDGSARSLRVTAAPISGSPDCSGACVWTPGFEEMPLASWSWKKVGGGTAAITFHLKNDRSNATADLTYYAGPSAPAGATTAIQVAPVAPENWVTVVRDLQEDARTALNWYNDYGNLTAASDATVATIRNQTTYALAGTTSGTPLGPDRVLGTGYTLSGVDNGYLLIDALTLNSAPSSGDGGYLHPSSAGDTTPIYEYAAAYADGTIHYFNAAGLLIGIADRNDLPGGTNENRVRLDYAISPNVAGQAAYVLTTIRAPTDGGSTGTGDTWQRELVVSHAGGVVTFSESLGTVGHPITGRATALTVDAATFDVTRIKPARQPSCATRSAGTGSGCIDLTYTAHRLIGVEDPRSDTVNNFKYVIVYDGSNQPTEVQDHSRSNAPLLRVLNYAVGGTLTPASARVLWQDAAAARLNAAIYTDLTSDGALLKEYAALDCATSNCLTNPPDQANLANQVREAHEFDGAARVSTVVTYRCPGTSTLVSGCGGTTPERIVSRRGQHASAAVDNYRDPLTAGELAWTQTPDEYAASMRDSSATNPDLYRTTYAYDGFGRPVTVTSQAANPRADYAALVKNTTANTAALTAYWRLDQPSGTFTDSSGNAYTGTATSVTYGVTGGLLGTTNKAASFNGSSSAVTSSAPLGSSAYTIEAWFKSGTAGQTGRGIAGDRSTDGVVLWLNGPGQIALAHNTTWVHSSIVPAVDRWYHAVATWDASVIRLYVDGELVAAAADTSAPGAGTSTFQIGEHADGAGGATNFSGAIDEVALWNVALTPAQVSQHANAGRAIVEDGSHTAYDRNWRPTQRDDQFLSSPGFENGLADWDLSGGSGGTICTSSCGRTTPSAFSTGLSGKAIQQVALVPGQTVRVQGWAKSSVGTISSKIGIEYWQSSLSGGAGGWTSLVSATANATSWTPYAWDVTLPLDTDGRLRVILERSGGSGGATVTYDDVAVLTSWANATYNANGTPLASQVLRPGQAGAQAGGAVAIIEVRNAYVADTSTSGVTAHPDIWPTTTTANYVNGSYDSTKPDEDVSSTVTYDAWGRTLVTTDPDGVSATTAYSASGTNGDKTDALTSADGLGNQTTRTYDLVGHVLTVVTPKSETTTNVYDLAGHVVQVTAPNGAITKTTYDTWGFKTVETANWVDGTPTAGGVDDVVTQYEYDRYGNLVTVAVDCHVASAGITANCPYTGFLDARTATTYDLAHNAVATTVYTGTGLGGTARTTTSYFETYTLPSSGPTIVRPKPSAQRGPIEPAHTATFVCPDLTITAWCNTSAVMLGAAGTAVSSLDMKGQAQGTQDANGILSRTFRDLAGRPVITVANYSDGDYNTSTASDKDIVSTTQYDLAGQVIRAVDVLGRSQVTTRDNLERVTAVTSKDSAGADVSVTKTVYTPGGRVDRVSAPDGTGVADASRSWTKTVYDDAGRAIRTIARYDTAGAAGMVVDSFEGTPLADHTLGDATGTIDGIKQAWSTAAGTFVASGGSASENHAASSARSGVSILSVTSGTMGSGIEWKLDGTFKSGRTYKATIWVNAASGKNVTVKFGNASQSVNSVHTGTAAWTRVTLTLTPAADRTGVVLALYSSTSGSGYTFLLDDAVVWDSATPDLNVPTSETINDANGAIIRTILPPGDPGTDEPLVTTTDRDSLGRPTTVTVNAIAGGGTGDSTSNLASTTHYDALGRVSDGVDVAGIKQTYTLDRLGRAIETIQNDTAGTAPTSLTDDKDIKSTFAYDALGELLAYCPAMQVTLFGGGTPCDRTATSVAAGDAYTRGWHWTYDDAGHQASEIPPVNQTAAALDTTLWAYNAAGQLTSQTSQNTTPTIHRHTDLTYDNVGRVTQSIVYQNSGTGTPKIKTTTSYLGDGAQDTVAVYLNGSGSASDTLNYTYDTAGRPDQLKRSGTVLTDFSWNADGTLSSRADGDAGAVGTTSFTYDWAKRITGATLPSGWQSGGGTASFTYRPDGLLATRKFNSDANAVTYAYDAAKRPTSLAKTLGTGSLSLTQAWDRSGNITSEGRSITGPTGDAGTNTQSFTYDNLNRLKGSTGLAAGTRTYTWDLDGNRRTKAEGADSWGATYDRTDALLQVTKNGGVATTSAYDTYGNLTTNSETGTTAGVVTLAYDLADRTISITPTGGTASTLVLDALGRVKTRTTGASVDTYSYAGATNNVVRIANAGGSGTTTDSVLDPSGLRFGTKTGATVAWLLADLHGSVAVGLNQAGTTVTDALRYDGAGMTVATYPGGGSAATKSWKYQGRLDVAASGPSLYDFQAREMSPGLGSFTSNDTVLGSATNPRQLNRYCYVAGNPTSFVDPDGHTYSQSDVEDDLAFAAQNGLTAGTYDDQFYDAFLATLGTTHDAATTYKEKAESAPIKLQVAPVPSGPPAGSIGPAGPQTAACGGWYEPDCPPKAAGPAGAHGPSDSELPQLAGSDKVDTGACVGTAFAAALGFSGLGAVDAAAFEINAVGAAGGPLELGVVVFVDVPLLVAHGLLIGIVVAKCM